MPNKTMKVYASLSKEYLYEEAIDNGLSEKAADSFKYFNEVGLVLTVDTETGKIESFELSG